MDFNESTGGTGVVQDIDFLCQTDATSYPLKDKARNANQWLHTAVGWIIDADASWTWNTDADGAYTATSDLSTGTTWTVGAGVYDFAVTIEASPLTVSQVQVKDSSGEYYKLDPIAVGDREEPLEELYKTNGQPRYYLLSGQAIRIYPAPAAADVTTSNGLKIIYTTSAYELEYDDTTESLYSRDIAPQFYRVITYGAAYDYLIKTGSAHAKAVREEIDRLRKDIYVHYGNRNKDDHRRFIPGELKRKYRV